MKKTFKFLLKATAVIAAVAGTIYIARDQIKEIIEKLKELKEGQEEPEDSFDEDSFDDDFFPEDEKDSRDYFSINITDDEEETTTLDS